MTLGRSAMAMVLSIAIGGTAWAIKEPETGLVFPDKAKCAGKPAKAAGVGVREATFGVDVYGVVAYASDAAAGQSLRKSSGCVKIRARFVRDVGADKIRKAWIKGLKKKGMAASDPTVKKLLSVVTGEMKNKQEMVIETSGETVSFRYMGRSVTITNAAKLGSAIKRIYLDSGSPTPALLEDVAKRKIARP